MDFRNHLLCPFSGAGSFTSSITGLSSGTTYHVRAYATNSEGTSYGSDVPFTASAIAPMVSTTAVSSVTSTSASSGGNVTSDGGASITARGVCWSTSESPTTSDIQTSDGTGAGSFTSSITGLSSGTTYHVRAYATNSEGTSYGSDVPFTASAIAPMVSTTAVSSVTSTSASSGGNVTSDGGASITARGVCWSTSESPTTSDIQTSDGTGAGSFTSSITGLSSGTTYHVRAYATNSEGISYGSDIPFTTSAIAPTVSTTAVSSVTSTSASSGGNVTSDGEDPITTRGVCWSTSENPTTSDIHTSDGTGAGSFTSAITGLSPGTTYHVRAYATNSAGTGYGDDLSFTASYSSTLYVIADGQCGQDPCYQTVQLALDAATPGTLIKIAEGVYVEAPNWKKAGTVTISGGWKNSFTEHNGMSEIYNPRATGGGNVKLQPSFKVLPQ